jgi:serine protease Do
VKLRALVVCPLLLLGLIGTPAEDEVAERSWLGVYLGDPVEKGVVILAVASRGPAQRGGLRAGDVLTSLGEAEIRTPEDVSGFLDRARPGTRVRAGLLRDGEAESLTIELEGRPAVWDPRRYRVARTAQADALRRAAAASAADGGWLGISLAEIPDDLRVHYGAPPGAGALVTRVAPESAASRAGIAVGDVLTRAGRTKLRVPGDLAAALVVGLSERELELEVVRGGKRQVFELQVRPVPMPEPGVEVGEVEERDGAEISIRIRLLEGELRRLEERIREIRAELERLKGSR